MGGTEVVSSGGVASATQVYGSEVVSSKGSDYGDTVHSGGALTVSSGGSVWDGLTISGGYAGISGTVASGQEVRFVGHGDLAFYDLAAFHARIGGYSTGDEFDLGGFAYSASETRSYTENSSHTGGTLSVHGSMRATLSLLGDYHTSKLCSQHRRPRRHICRVCLTCHGRNREAGWRLHATLLLPILARLRFGC